jgi:glutaredoxin
LVSFAVYHYEGCPYCDFVRAAARAQGVDITWRDIEREPQHRRDLVEARGRATVPVLRISREGAPDEWMPESRDIVRFFEQQGGTRTRGRAIRTGAPRHWAIAGALALGTLSLLLSGLGIADLQWWWVAFGVAAVVLASAVMRGRAARSDARPDDA